MDDSWQLRHPNRPYSQHPTSAAVPLNYSDSGPGRHSSPYVAQEFSVVDRNSNVQQAMASNPQNSQSKAGRREFSNMFPTMMLWENLQQLRSSVVQQPTSIQSSFLASNEHLFASLCDPGGGWPLSVSGGFEASGAAAGHLQDIRGQGLVHLPVTGVFDSVGSALLRSSTTELSKQALSLGRQVYETGLQSQCAASLWQLENGRQILSTAKHSPSLNRNTKPVSSGFSHHQASTKASQLRPRVYCTSMSGSIIVGEIIISEMGRLGVMCFCHNRHMSVACFSEHAGRFNVNPGVVVQMESGETLLQWRNTLFSQFGVKALEDHIGWVWYEASSNQLEPSKRKGDTFQREVALSCQSGPFTAKDRVGHTFDNVFRIKCPSGNPTSKEGCLPSYDGQKVSHTSSENVLRDFGKSFKQNNGVDSMLNRLSFFESIPGKPDGVLSPLLLGNSTLSSSSIHHSSLIAENPSSESAINTSCVTTMESSSVLGNKPLQKCVDYSGWNYSQNLGHAEKGRLVSNFELTLGQPSQHDMSLGSAFSNRSQPRQPQSNGFGNAFVIDRAGQPAALQQNIQSCAERSAAEQTDAFSVSLGQGKGGLPSKNHHDNVMKSRELQAWAFKPKNVEDRGMFISSHMPEVVSFGDVRHRHDQDLRQGAALVVSAGAHHTPPQYLNNASSGQHADTQISCFAQMPLKNISEESRNFFVNIHCQDSNLHTDSRVAIETRMENLTKGYCSPLRCIPQAFSVSESVAEKTGETHAAVVDSGASCSSHTCWIKRSLCDADSEAISSCNQNLSAVCETINQGASEQGRVLEDDSEVVDAAKDSVEGVVSTDSAQTGNRVHTHADYELDCINAEVEQLPRDLPIEKVVSEHHLCADGDMSLGCRDSDDPENLAHQCEEQSSLQQPDAPSITFEHEKKCTGERSKSSELADLKGENPKVKDPFLMEGTFFDAKVQKINYLGQSSIRELTVELGCKELIYDNTNDENSGTGKCFSSEVRDMQTRPESCIEESPTASNLVRKEGPPFPVTSAKNFDTKSITTSTECVSLFEANDPAYEYSPNKASGLGKTCLFEEVDMVTETMSEPTYVRAPEEVLESRLPMPYYTSSEAGCSDRPQKEDGGPRLSFDSKLAHEKLDSKADRADCRGKNRRKAIKQKHMDAATSKGARKVLIQREDDRDPTSTRVGGAVRVTDHTASIKSLKRKRSMVKCNSMSNVQQKDPCAQSGSYLTHKDANHRVQGNCQNLMIKLSRVDGKQVAETACCTAEINDYTILKTSSSSSLAREVVAPYKLKHKGKQNISSSLIMSSRYPRKAHKHECFRAVKMALLSDILNRPREDKNVQSQPGFEKQIAIAPRHVRKSEAAKFSKVEKMVVFTGSASDRKEIRQRSLCELTDMTSYSTAKNEFVENASTAASSTMNPRAPGGAAKTLGPKERGNITQPPAKSKEKKSFMASAQGNANGLSSGCSVETKPFSRLARKPNLADHVRSEKVWPAAVVGRYQVMRENKESTCSESSPNCHHQKQKRVHFDVRTLEEHICCVCGRAHSESTNVLISCNHCGIYVHQACYGIVKVPKAYWLCRICKVSAPNAVCVLCGYPNGAMTRAAKSQGIAKELQQAWQEEKGGKSRLYHPHANGHPSMDVLLPPSVCSGCQFEKCTCRTNRLHGREKEVPSSYKPFGSTVSGVAYEDSRHCKAEGSSMCGSPSLHDQSGSQWVHVVCALWMPGTRCLNVTNMSAFDVSGVATARRKLVCSLCRRPGGACITCQVGKCSTPFHPWCAHIKGLLQNVSFDGNEGKVRFFGKCILHRNEAVKSMEFRLHSELRRQQDTSASVQITRQEDTVCLSICKRKRSSRKYIKRKNCTLENGP